MQKCSYCGKELLENARFCGKCGSAQGPIATDAVTTRSNTPPPQSWGSAESTMPATRPPHSNYPAQGNTSGWSTLDSAAPGGDVLLGSGQAYTPGTPVVQGTPQMGNIPNIAGSPTPYPTPGPAHASANSPSLGPLNASASHPGLGSGSSATSGSVNAPAAHPTLGQLNASASHPSLGSQPTHYAPEQLGAEEYHSPHSHQGHHTYPSPHTAASVTKVAGGSTIKTIVIVALTVVVVAGGGIGAAAYFLTRPQPLISITSNYKVGNALAGANGTVLHVSGQKFSSNSAITFLLDGQDAPGNPGTQSDSHGSFARDVPITSAWSVGIHTLTARDASNYSTNNSVTVTIVPQGQANTPGPDGAPPDDATFILTITQNGTIDTVNQTYTRTAVINVVGHPDPAGGSACLDRDNGQPQTSSNTSVTGTSYTETNSFSCQGSYKGGKISYTETVLTDIVNFTDGSGISCTLASPQTKQQLTGSYTSRNTFTGTFTSAAIPASDYNCADPSQSFHYLSSSGSWTGNVAS
ncbi:MAG TPA: zinc-ribbon domain-containing protein [Ktedonobacteraceae bacterium]